jgi:hypothetical protein
MGSAKTKDVEVQTHIVPRVVQVDGQDVYYEKYKIIDGAEVAVLENGKEVTTDNAQNAGVRTTDESAADQPAEANPAE